MIAYIFEDYEVYIGLILLLFGIVFAGFYFFSRSDANISDNQRTQFGIVAVCCIVIGVFVTSLIVGTKINKFERFQKAITFLNENQSVFALSVDYPRKDDYVPRLETDYHTCKKLADILNDLNATKNFAPRYDCDLKLLGEYNTNKD